ncbi:uncharacterized protein SOCEGT47_026040 [Sorangium cellulosum]|uniref:Uncharacterized protein n=1 Tax=Sorangium cellulosum TaxID=56 RepID=A0A4P2Q004_SORCE|nr:uncharacterized protein SOCEGT47_026040 [Sorangium cellulosum]
MRGLVVVTDHPLFAVSGDDGSLTLEKAPHGESTPRRGTPVTTRRISSWRPTGLPRSRSRMLAPSPIPRRTRTKFQGMG